MHHQTVLVAALALVGAANAQFNFFENIFQGQQFQQQQQHQQQHHHQGQAPEAPSDSEWYGRVWYDTWCSKYLCPGTLACVDIPQHCPCAHPPNEDKMELGGGAALCASKGGYRPGEMARKIELARKGLL